MSRGYPFHEALRSLVEGSCVIEHPSGLKIRPGHSEDFILLCPDHITSDRWIIYHPAGSGPGPAAESLPPALVGVLEQAAELAGFRLKLEPAIWPGEPARLALQVQALATLPDDPFMKK